MFLFTFFFFLIIMRKKKLYPKYFFSCEKICIWTAFLMFAYLSNTWTQSVLGISYRLDSLHTYQRPHSIHVFLCKQICLLKFEFKWKALLKNVMHFCVILICFESVLFLDFHFVWGLKMLLQCQCDLNL